MKIFPGSKGIFLLNIYYKKIYGLSKPDAIALAQPEFIMYGLKTSDLVKATLMLIILTSMWQCHKIYV